MGCLVVFVLDERGYALRLTAVERIVRAVEVLPLPKAPEIVLGVVNVHGRVIPVVDIRKRFRLPAREMRLSDQLILARTSKRRVGLVADTVSGLLERSAEEVVLPETIVPGLEYVAGVAKLEDGLLLIHDLDRFLSLEEEKRLDQALGKGPPA